MKNIVPLVALVALVVWVFGESFQTRKLSAENVELAGALAALKCQVESNTVTCQSALAATTAANRSASDIPGLKIWVLNQLQTVEMEQAEKRFELTTNLQALIFSTARIAIESK